MKLTCQGMSKVYQTRNGPISAIENISFTTRGHEWVCIVGPSGCGKTTLLKLIAGLVEPSSGNISFSDEPLNGRLRSALVFQEHGLFPWMNVLDNVAFGLEMEGVGKKQRVDQAQAFIEKVGLARFSRNYPHELSVGMRQRVGIARAFVANPPVLLMDEPFGSLDAQTKRVLQQELLNLWKDHPKLILYVTHDLEEAVFLADRILVMSGHPGRIRSEVQIPGGRPRDLSCKEPDLMEIKWSIWRILEEEVKKAWGH